MYVILLIGIILFLVTGPIMLAYGLITAFGPTVGVLVFLYLMGAFAPKR